MTEASNGVHYIAAPAFDAMFVKISIVNKYWICNCFEFYWIFILVKLTQCKLADIYLSIYTTTWEISAIWLA